MKNYLFLSFLLFSVSSFAQLTTGLNFGIVNTNSGKVRGYQSNGVYTYMGIPYGTAKRFETAQKPKPWTENRSTMTWGPVAPLLSPTTSVQDETEWVFDHDFGYTNEDCLVLNVWTNGINDGKKRPVMFWIHGGGFTAGSSQELPSYHGENLAKGGDVVVVSINHRLNILGFLDLSAYGEKYKYSANNSVLDMRLALEWVRDNIANFGGDPNNVTIFGQSGGGAKVNTLMAMPSAKGLFHKAINQSGAFRGNMLGQEVTRQISAEVLKELGISTNNLDDIQIVPFEKLSAAGNKAIRTVSEKFRSEGRPVAGFGLSWGPSLDGDLLPYDMLSQEALQLSKNIPLMIGTTITEFMPSIGLNMLNASNESVRSYLDKTYPGKTDKYLEYAKKAWPTHKRPSDLMDIDMRFRPGAVYQANVKSAVSGGAPVYIYLFDWQSPVLDGKYKSVHCMEIAFAFNTIQRTRNMTGGTKEAQKLADKVNLAWVNFAKTGNPNHKGLPKWPAYTEQNTSTMHFDNVCTVKPQLDKELIELVTGQ
ncbi:MAG TPA: carboxylesterase family protein [Saprospiraceae bacterium]|nr:carboxylesterase family protein [Saprospiraceae bacterium]